MLRDWTGRITVAELNKALRPGGQAHVDRYAETLTYLTAMSPSIPLPPGFEDLKALARSDMRARERVLYVEVAPSGAPMTPEGVGEDEARVWLSAMIKYSVSLGSVWRSGLDDALAVARDAEHQLPR